MVAGPSDSGLKVVDHEFGRYAIEELKSPSVTAQPRGHLLVTNDLDVLVATEGQHHHEHPGAERLTRMDVRDRRTFTEVHLCHVTRIEVQNRAGIRMRGIELLKKATDRRIRTGEAVVPDQSLVDCLATDTTTPPGGHLRLVRQHQRLRLGSGGRSRLQHPGERCVVGERTGRVQPPVVTSELAEDSGLLATHYT